MKRYLLILFVFGFTTITFAQRFDVDTISLTGPLDNRINMVFLSDGYQEEDLDKFIEDVNWMLDAIFNQAPYTQYRDYFNAFAIKVPSIESGAANDPDSLINNYFGSTFNWAGIWRLVVPAYASKVQTVLSNNFPQYDQVFMLVNDDRYGGSGGWIATNTTHSNGPEICIHEMGHSFAGLRDEYWAGQQYAREGINMTQESDPELVRWTNWYGFNGTGIYPHSESPTWYRPHQNCEMRFLNRDFCPVCQEAITSTILNLTNPVISYKPAINDFQVTNTYLDFTVSLLEPDPNTLKLSWILNDSILTSSTDSLRILDSQLLPGQNQMKLSILDTTQYIRMDNHREIHSHQISWNFDWTASGIAEIKTYSFNMDLYPNPVHDQLNIRYYFSEPGWHFLDILDLNGKTIRIKEKTNHLAGQDFLQVDLSRLNLKSGNYFVRISSDQGIWTQAMTINSSF